MKSLLLFSVFLSSYLGLCSDKDLPRLGTRTKGQDWPQFLGPGQDNKSIEKGIITHWGKDGPNQVWSMVVGQGYSAPTTSRGRLFFFDRLKNEARLSCLEAETGKLIWRKTYPVIYEDMYGYSNGPRISPLIEGDRVYTYGVEGRLRCHKILDGALIWDVDTVSQYGVKQNFFGVGASPVLFKNLLIAQIGGSPANSPGVGTGETTNNGTGIVAFNKLTGKEVYRLGDELASYAMPRLARQDGRDWCFVLARGGLLAFNPKTGKQDFHIPWRAKKLESVNAATPVVVNDQVFITESYGPGGALLKFKTGGYEMIRKDGRRDQALASHWQTPVLHNGYLYGAHGMGGKSEFRCISLATGDVIWRKDGFRHFNPLYVDQHFVLTTEGGHLILVEASSKAYKEVARVEKLVRSPAYNTAVLSHGLLYVLGNDKLICLELIK